MHTEKQRKTPTLHNTPPTTLTLHIKLDTNKQQARRRSATRPPLLAAWHWGVGSLVKGPWLALHQCSALGVRSGVNAGGA